MKVVGKCESRIHEMYKNMREGNRATALKLYRETKSRHWLWVLKDLGFSKEEIRAMLKSQ